MSARIDLWPVAVIEDRYGGVYSGGAWLAIAEATIHLGLQTRVGWCLDDGPHGDDGDAMEFWAEPPPWIAVGATPDEARNALYSAVEKSGAGQ